MLSLQPNWVHVAMLSSRCKIMNSFFSGSESNRGGKGQLQYFFKCWMLRLILFSIVCSEWAAVSFFKFWTDFSNKYVLHNNAYGGIKTISNFFGINCGNLPPFTVAISWFLYWFYQGSSPCLKYTVCSCCWQQRASQLQLLLALTGLLEKKMLWF